MPVTIAHPAAVLPLRGLGLPLSAMVIGSMAPDLPVFSQSWGIYRFTHSLAGILTIDLALTLVLLAFWDLWGRDALVDTSPSAFRDRLPGRARIGRRAWALAPLAAVIGSITHVVWDAFTHSGRWGVRMIGWLREEHAGMRGDQWAQYASGVIGIAVLGAVILAILRQPVLGDRRPRRLPAPTLPGGMALAAACSVATFVGRVIDEPFGLAAFHAAVVGIVAAGVVVVVIALAWVLSRDTAEELAG